MAFTKELVFRWTEFGFPRTTCFYSFCSGTRSKTRANFFSCSVPAHYGPTSKTATSSFDRVSVNNMYVGGFLHADDIRTLAPNTSTLEAQIPLVKRFTEENFLKFNPSKCEIVAFKKAKEPADAGEVRVDECSFPVREILVLDNSGSLTCHLRTQFKFVFKKLVGPSLCISRKVEPSLLLFN